MSHDSIEKARLEDLPQILQIYAYARKFMKQSGNPRQWGNSFPPENLLVKDIEKEQLYVVKDDAGIHGVFAFIIGKEPTYEKIEAGAWISDTEYGTLHRVAGDGTVHGIFDKIVDFCEQKIEHLRIDTHEENRIMQHLISKNGFQKCGIIHVLDETPRIAYERLKE